MSSEVAATDVNWGRARLFYPYQESDLVGQILTFLETLNMPEKQDKAVKDVMKHMLYGFFNNSIHVPSEVAETLRKA